MDTIKIPGFNNCLKPPENWDATKSGECTDLYIRAERGTDGLPYCTSAWMPNEAELAALNRGMPVLLTIVTAKHPPVIMRIGKISDLPMTEEQGIARADKVVDLLVARQKNGKGNATGRR